ncbi:hypothetical protein GE061_004540 [Apolygus lucorum]|uniref:Uncharacterized protein n=1 Tax=Apolygus lucorum TaxID=248454 RepID=A0A8S9WZG9_APOLU|nr:hypothetical protein GE061_004540 [Apolygus lucorum]
MEYQYSGPGGTTMSEREDRNELCTVGTVLASERRKSVVTTDYSCTSATHTTLPSTSPDVAAAASPRVSDNEDDYSLVRAQPGKDVLMVPAVPTATSTATSATTEQMSAATRPTTSTATSATTEWMSAATLPTTSATELRPTTSAITETMRSTTSTATSSTRERMFRRNASHNVDRDFRHDGMDARRNSYHNVGYGIASHNVGNGLASRDVSDNRNVAFHNVDRNFRHDGTDIRRNASHNADPQLPPQRN